MDFYGKYKTKITMIIKIIKYSILFLFVFLLYKDYTNDTVNDTVNEGAIDGAIEGANDTLTFKSIYRFEDVTYVITEKIVYN